MSLSMYALSAAALLAQASPKMLDLSEIHERATKLGIETSPPTAAPDVSPDSYADQLWPRRGKDLTFPAVVVENGRRDVVEAKLSKATVEVVNSAAKAFRDGDYESAAKLYEKGLKDEPRSFVLLSHLGDCRFGLKKYSEALELYEQAIQEHPTDHRIWWYRAQALAHLGRREAAISSLAQALVLRPGYPMLLEWLQKNGEQLGIRASRETAFVPKAFVRREGSSARVFTDTEDLHWWIYGECKAVWLVDASRRKEATGTERPTFTTFEEAECLAPLVTLYLSERKRSGIRAEPALDALGKVFDDGFLDGFIVYELGARYAPWFTLLLDEQGQEAVRKYVRKYVLVPRER